MTVLALDIGGSGVRAARVEGSTAVRRCSRELTPAVSATELRAKLHAVLGGLEPDQDDVAVGVAFPGFLDRSGRVGTKTYLAQMVGMDLCSELAAIVPGRPVAVLPDLAAAALGEARVAALAGRVLCVGVGSGANAALAVNGEVLEVAGGALGDAGHVIVEADGPECRCGGRGCLEAVCSGWALARDGAAEGFADAAAVDEAARRGNATACAILERAGRALGRGIASWAAVTFPDHVVVVGGLSRAGEALLKPARAELLRVGSTEIVAGLPVAVGRCGADAALLGAADAAAGLASGDLPGATASHQFKTTKERHV